MSREDYEVVIGLETHAELSTKTKIFCSCPTEFGGEPNTHCCPICMAMPGTLPVLNERVVEYAVKAGLATNCEISRNSKNDRKNYFYPDLPKAYQISQFDMPLCEKGYVEIEDENGEKKKIRLTRIHIEEDAGKLNHDEYNLLDNLEFKAENDYAVYFGWNWLKWYDGYDSVDAIESGLNHLRDKDMSFRFARIGESYDDYEEDSYESENEEEQDLEYPSMNREFDDSYVIEEMERVSPIKEYEINEM